MPSSLEIDKNILRRSMDDAVLLYSQVQFKARTTIYESSRSHVSDRPILAPTIPHAKASLPDTNDKFPSLPPLPRLTPPLPHVNYLSTT